MSVQNESDARAAVALLTRESSCPEARSNAVGGRLKRCFDLAFALATLISFSPLFLIIAAMIKLSDGGPVLYRHQRIGRQSRPFVCLKFRTMTADADAALKAYLQSLPDAEREWREFQKLRTDPRVTELGSVLRQLSLDELPQLINVIRGEMSLVGPRPIVVDEISKYGPNAKLYFRARPGLTGAWQVSGRSDTSYDQRVKLDCEYVETWSLWRDLVIIVKTIPAVLSAKGSY
jgi:exopolysaccharide production protein ExoY